MAPGIEIGRIQRTIKKFSKRTNSLPENTKKELDKPQAVSPISSANPEDLKREIVRSTSGVMLRIMGRVRDDHNSHNPDQPATIEAGYADPPGSGEERMGGPVWLISWGHTKVVAVFVDTLGWVDEHVFHGIEKRNKKEGSPTEVEWKPLELRPDEERLGILAKIKLAMRHADQREIKEKKEGDLDK